MLNKNFPLSGAQGHGVSIGGWGYVWRVTEQSRWLAVVVVLVVVVTAVNWSPLQESQRRNRDTN